MYGWEGMVKISYLEAAERFRKNLEVYLLYDDDSEGLAETIEEIERHQGFGGEFGYEIRVS